MADFPIHLWTLKALGYEVLLISQYGEIWRRRRTRLLTLTSARASFGLDWYWVGCWPEHLPCLTAKWFERFRPCWRASVTIFRCRTTSWWRRNRSRWLIWWTTRKKIHLWFYLLETNHLINPIFPGGAHYAPHVTYLRISVQIRVGAHWKNLSFFNYEFWKGQYTFYPVKLSRFAEKNKVRRKYQNFIRESPYEPGQTPLWQTKVSKVKSFFGGFWASKLTNPFEYDKLLKDNVPPPPRSLIHQNRLGQIGLNLILQ